MWFLYLLLTLFLLDILVVLHEGGHYLVARLCGIKVLEFSVGMGPKVISHVSKKSGIRYSFRAFPIGGFVQMEGEDGDSDEEGSFSSMPLSKRLATVLAGPFVNILIGFICMFFIVLFSTPVSTVVYGFQEGATSSGYGLAAGDEIIKVGPTRVHSGSELVYEILNRGYEPVDLTVVRDGEKILLPGVVFPTEEEEGTSFGRYDFILYAMRKTPGNLLEQAFFRSVSTVKMVFDSIGGLITGRFGIDSVSGPIGISSAVGEAAKAGFSSLFYLFTVISVNLGIMNLLPLPALDGGRILMLLIELVIRRRVKPEVEGYINFAGMVLLLTLTALITAKDIIKLF